MLSISVLDLLLDGPGVRKNKRHYREDDLTNEWIWSSGTKDQQLIFLRLAIRSTESASSSVSGRDWVRN